MLNKIKDFFCKPRIVLIYDQEGPHKGDTAFMLLNDSTGIDKGATLQIGKDVLVTVMSTDVISVKFKEKEDEK